VGDAGVSVGGSVRIPVNRSRAPIALDPRSIGRVEAAVRRFDVLHVHEPLVPFVSLAALRAGPAVVATFHAAPSRFGRGLYGLSRPWIRRIMRHNVRRVTAVSETAASTLPDDLEVVIVPNGIDVSAFDVDEPHVRRRVSFLGRDEPRKGLDVLLRSWGEVSRAMPETELVVMGADRGVAGIRWLGPVDDDTKIATLGTSQVYVAPNLGGESFGIVVLEGMAAGAAVVASDLEAFRSVGGEAVLYFGTGDADALAQTLIDLLGDEQKCAELSKLGRARAAEFDWAVVAPRYRLLYEEALS
jgi:phosphatidylinositol alpha-mannosyltransferase